MPVAPALLVRSWLFCPASKPERFEKAAASGADAVIVDLEDAVGPAEKAEARRHAIAWLAAPTAATAFRCLRPNALRTPDGLRDLLALIDAGVAPDHLVVPKTESASELAVLDGLLAGRSGATRFLPLVETARGLAAVETIAAHPRVAGVVLGGADLVADLGAELAWEPLLLARSRLVQAAAMAGVAAIDVPYLAFADVAGTRDETDRVRRLGFTGKLAIHPGQVAPIHDAFTPQAADVERARRVLAAVDAAAGGVAVVDGTMVDAPLVRAAERTLALAAYPTDPARASR
jgi:citrate lyase beta subunit